MSNLHLGWALGHWYMLMSLGLGRQSILHFTIYIFLFAYEIFSSWTTICESSFASLKGVASSSIIESNRHFEEWRKVWYGQLQRIWRKAEGGFCACTGRYWGAWIHLICHSTTRRASPGKPRLAPFSWWRRRSDPSTTLRTSSALASMLSLFFKRAKSPNTVCLANINPTLFWFVIFPSAKQNVVFFLLILECEKHDMFEDRSMLISSTIMYYFKF